MSLMMKFKIEMVLSRKKNYRKVLCIDSTSRRFMNPVTDIKEKSRKRPYEMNRNQIEIDWYFYKLKQYKMNWTCRTYKKRIKMQIIMAV